jgi:hypothetical protein
VGLAAMLTCGASYLDHIPHFASDPAAGVHAASMFLYVHAWTLAAAVMRLLVRALMALITSLSTHAGARPLAA